MPKWFDDLIVCELYDRCHDLALVRSFHLSSKRTDDGINDPDKVMVSSGRYQNALPTCVLIFY